jgi:hypothetical protein
VLLSLDFNFRPLLALGAAIMLALGGSAGPAAAQDRSLEYAVKATYLYKFVPFVAWPTGAFAAPASPFQICIVGESRFASLVANGVAGQSAEGHSLVVRRVTTTAEENGCQVLFISSADAAVLDATLVAVRGRPVLTVTDAAPNGEHGIVNFLLLDDRVRFQIDLGAAARNGIAISSKLLSLAVDVQPAPAERRP